MSTTNDQQGSTSRREPITIFVSLELSRVRWLVTWTFHGSTKMSNYWLRVSGFAGPGDGEGSAGDAGSRCRGDDLVTSWAGRRQFILLRTQ